MGQNCILLYGRSSIKKPKNKEKGKQKVTPKIKKKKQRIGAMWGPSPFEIPKNCDFKKCAPAAWAGFQIKFQIYAISFSLLCFFFLPYMLRNKQFLFFFFYFIFHLFIYLYNNNNTLARIRSDSCVPDTCTSPSLSLF